MTKQYDFSRDDRIIFKKDSGLGRYKKRKVFLFLGKIIWPFYFLSGLCAIFYFIFFSGYFSIKSIEIRENEFGISGLDLIQDAAAGFLEKKNYNFFPGANWFLLRPAKLEASLQQKFPEIETIEVKKKFSRTLAIEIIRREIAGIYCVSEDCFYLNGEGIIFENAPINEGFLTLKINGRPEKEIILGEIAIDKIALGKLNRIKTTLRKDQEFLIGDFTILENNEVLANTNQEVKVYFNLSEDIDFQILSLKESLEKIPAEEFSKLDYIDLRMKGRVYYK